MNTTEMKAIVLNAIKESELNGYKWNFDGNKLTWSYLTVEYFSFEIEEIDEIEKFVKVIYHMPHLNTKETFTAAIVGDIFYGDFKTVEEAIAGLTKATIKKANSTF